MDTTDCKLCRGAGLCPQCDGYGNLTDRIGRSGEPCPLCSGDTCCPHCTDIGAADAVHAVDAVDAVMA